MDMVEDCRIVDVIFQSVSERKYYSTKVQNGAKSGLPDQVVIS